MSYSIYNITSTNYEKLMLIPLQMTFEYLFIFDNYNYFIDPLIILYLYL